MQGINIDNNTDHVVGMSSYTAPKCGEEPSCPSKCRCTEGVVDCRDLGLTAIPSNLPEDTMEM